MPWIRLAPGSAMPLALAVGCAAFAWATPARSAPAESVRIAYFQVGTGSDAPARELADAELATVRGRHAPVPPPPSRSKRKVILWDEAFVEAPGNGRGSLGEGNRVRLRGGGL